MNEPLLWCQINKGYIYLIFLCLLLFFLIHFFFFFLSFCSIFLANIQDALFFKKRKTRTYFCGVFSVISFNSIYYFCKFFKLVKMCIDAYIYIYIYICIYIYAYMHIWYVHNTTRKCSNFTYPCLQYLNADSLLGKKEIIRITNRFSTASGRFWVCSFLLKEHFTQLCTFS